MKLFKKKTSLGQSQQELRRIVERQRTGGIPLQHIIHSLNKIYDQALKQAEHTTQGFRPSSPNFEKAMVLHQDQMKWAQSIDKERRRLYSIMADRNKKGMQLEREGHTRTAVALYEANVLDRFEGTHPYNRLRIIYVRQGQPADATRVCQAYLTLPTCQGEDKRQFQEHLKKLREKSASP